MRRAVEGRLADEEAALRSLVAWLLEGRPFARWPARELGLLASALRAPADPGETRKALALTRHLFRRTEPPVWTDLPTLDDDARTRCLVERVRADLTGLVPLGAGLRGLDLPAAPR